MFISTISIAEYCVGLSRSASFKNLKILPFNLEHSKKAGEFARILFQARSSGLLNISERILIPNDAKLFAQADTEVNINHFLTSDTRSLTTFNSLKGITPKLNIIDINIDHSQTFGLLNL